MFPRLRTRASTPARRRRSESRDDSTLNASTRTGREAVRASPPPRHTSSLPRMALTPAVNRESVQPLTPHAVQKNSGVQPQFVPDARLNQTFTKSQLVTKLRQSAASSDTKTLEGQHTSDRQRGSTPVRAYTPVQHPTPQNNPSTIKHTVAGNSHKSQRPSSSYSSAKGQIVTADRLPPRPFTQIRKSLSGNLGDIAIQARSTPNSAAHKNGQHRKSTAKQTPAAPGEALLLNDHNNQQSSNVLGGTHPPPHITPDERPPGGLVGGMARGCLFTPPPITPDQEASLYQSLEHEILSNLQQLGFSLDSDDCSGSSSVCSGTAEENDSQHSSPCHRFTQEPSQDSSPGSACLADTPCVQQKQGSRVSSSAVPLVGGGSNPRDIGFDCVIDELQQERRPLEKVSVERWVNTLPFSSQGSRPGVTTTSTAIGVEVDASSSKPTQPCVASSWSSVGSSLESRERAEVASAPPLSQTVDTSGVTRDSDRQRRPRSSSFRQQRRSLKKPERVPSIYKLKLKPHIRPRQDNRPDRKPSKIPKPISYRRSRTSEEAGSAKDCTDNGVSSERNNRGSSRLLSDTPVDLNSSHITQAFPYEDVQGVSAFNCPAEELESWVWGLTSFHIYIQHTWFSTEIKKKKNTQVSSCQLLMLIFFFVPVRDTNQVDTCRTSQTLHKIWLVR